MNKDVFSNSWKSLITSQFPSPSTLNTLPIKRPAAELNLFNSTLDVLEHNGFIVISIESLPTDIYTNTIAMMEQIILRLKQDDLVLEHCLLFTISVPDMLVFDKLNQAYGSFFTDNPPARVTIECSYQSPLRIECIASEQRTGNLHVQSISHWAPANIGPYSQATFTSSLMFLAGQIGLVPHLMALPDDLQIQVGFALSNLQAVVSAIKGSIIQCVCFVIESDSIELVKSKWLDMFECDLSFAVVSMLPRNAMVEFAAVAFRDNEGNARHDCKVIKCGLADLDACLARPGIFRVYHTGNVSKKACNPQNATFIQVQALESELLIQPIAI